MEYTKEFKEIVKFGAYIGTGNPNSKILIVGKEVATDTEDGLNKPLENKNLKDFEKNSIEWKKNIDTNKNQGEVLNWPIESNPLFAFKGTIKKKTSDTWKKYQKLHDLIFKGNINKNNELELDFQKDFFITEMSEIPSKTTNKAQNNINFKEKLKYRKDNFFTSNYIQNFPVIILACSNYIINHDENREIDDIFNVSFIEEKGTEKQKFWIHKSKTNKPKLVIHTRQLSNAVEDNLLIGIAKEINEFLK
jgi:hypothetical protein